MAVSDQQTDSIMERKECSGKEYEKQKELIELIEVLLVVPLAASACSEMPGQELSAPCLQ